MASLSRSQFTDFYPQKTCKEASSSMFNPSSSNIHIQGLYNPLKHTQLHPKYPHAPTPPHYDPYSMIGKPFYYSSHVHGMSKGHSEVEEPSCLLMSPHHASASTVTSTSQDDQVSSLQHPLKQPAMDCKAPHPTRAAATPGGDGNGATKKRMRAATECKDTENKEADAKKRTKVGDCEFYLQRKPEGLTRQASKPAITNAEKLKTTSPLKHSISTEQRSLETKSSVTKSSSPTLDHGSPTKPDFIHVRARRGQATDSHSLAERVRREKISERMKYLQDLVPSCIKVTGKAMMLDEIINYVQSLQRQVEFLSMKLAAVPPSRLEFSLDDLFGCKKVLQPSNLNGTCISIPGSGAAVQAFAPPTEKINNEHSGLINTMMRSNDIFHESAQSHDMNSSMQLQTSNHEMMGCSPADSFFENLTTEFGVNDALLHPSAAGSSNSSLVASPADVVLDPPPHSCSQSSQLEMEWDDDLQNIVQQMGCFSQASSSWLPASDHLLSEGFFLQGNLKEEL